MITVIHGADSVSSRNFLFFKIEEFRGDGGEVKTIDGTKLDFEELSNLVISESLLKEKRLVVIENLLSKKESKEKGVLLELISSSKEDIILWESGSIKKQEFSVPAEFKEFKSTPAVFSLLDSLGGERRGVLANLNKSLNEEPIELIISAVLTRLHWLLVAGTAPENLNASGYYRSKLISQARVMGLPRISNLMKRLLSTELAVKTGKTNMNLLVAVEIELSQSN